jgi:hypothetical protein
MRLVSSISTSVPAKNFDLVSPKSYSILLTSSRPSREIGTYGPPQNKKRQPLPEPDFTRWVGTAPRAKLIGSEI